MIRTRVVGRPSREGAQVEFEPFFRTEYPRLVGALYLLAGSRGEAEELAQDAMVQAFERWPRVRAMESPGGYVYGIALNLNRHRLRRLAMRARIRLSPRTPTDPAATTEVRSDLMRGLAALPPGQREALVLTEWVGLDSEEAGRVLGIEPGSVRSRVSRARATLRTIVEVDDA